jgi:hypothetical protein
MQAAANYRNRLNTANPLFVATKTFPRPASKCA